MSVRSLDQLKSWFQQGCYPVASQFADWMDSFRHKDELIGLSDVEGLSEQLNGKSNASEVAALQAQTEALGRDFAAHCTESAADIEALYTGLDELETSVPQQIEACLAEHFKNDIFCLDGGNANWEEE